MSIRRLNTKGRAWKRYLFPFNTARPIAVRKSGQKSFKMLCYQYLLAFLTSREILDEINYTVSFSKNLSNKAEHYQNGGMFPFPDGENVGLKKVTYKCD